MKLSENIYRERNPRYDMVFVGGKDRVKVSEDTIAYIEDNCEEELLLLDYKHKNAI